MQVYLRDGSPQTILRAATLRQKLQIQLSTSPSHSILTPHRPVSALTLYHQGPGRVPTGVPILKSLVWLDPEKSCRKQDSKCDSSTLKADALTTRPMTRSSATSLGVIILARIMRMFSFQLTLWPTGKDRRSDHGQPVGHPNMTDTRTHIMFYSQGPQRDNSPKHNFMQALWKPKQSHEIFQNQIQKQSDKDGYKCIIFLSAVITPTSKCWRYLKRPTAHTISNTTFHWTARQLYQHQHQDHTISIATYIHIQMYIDTNTHTYILISKFRTRTVLQNNLLFVFDCLCFSW